MSTEETWLHIHGRTDTSTILSYVNTRKYETTISINLETLINYQDFEEEITTQQQTTKNLNLVLKTDIGIDELSTTSIIRAELEEIDYADETDRNVSTTKETQFSSTERIQNTFTPI